MHQLRIISKTAVIAALAQMMSIGKAIDHTPGVIDLHPGMLSGPTFDRLLHGFRNGGGWWLPASYAFRSRNSKQAWKRRGKTRRK